MDGGSFAKLIAKITRSKIICALAYYSRVFKV